MIFESVWPPTSGRAIRRDQRGGCSAKPQGRPAGKFGKLVAHIDFLLEKVRAQPDMTLHELTAALEVERGVAAHRSSVNRALARVGQSYKKT